MYIYVYHIYVCIYIDRNVHFFKVYISTCTRAPVHFECSCMSIFSSFSCSRVLALARFLSFTLSICKWWYLRRRRCPASLWPDASLRVVCCSVLQCDVVYCSVHICHKPRLSPFSAHGCVRTVYIRACMFVFWSMLCIRICSKYVSCIHAGEACQHARRCVRIYIHAHQRQVLCRGRAGWRRQQLPRLSPTLRSCAAQSSANYRACAVVHRYRRGAAGDWWRHGGHRAPGGAEAASQAAAAALQPPVDQVRKKENTIGCVRGCEHVVVVCTCAWIICACAPL